MQTVTLWEDEAALQHLYGIGILEGRVYLAHVRDRLGFAEIAANYNLAVQTARNMYTNARHKIEAGGNLMDLIILNQRAVNGQNATLKNCAVSVLISFYATVMGYTVEDNVNTKRICGIDAAIRGDIAWVDDNVFRFVDAVGVRDANDALNRTVKMVQRYQQANPANDPRMGIDVLRRKLDQMYIVYDIYGNEEAKA